MEKRLSGIASIDADSVLKDLGKQRPVIAKVTRYLVKTVI